LLPPLTLLLLLTDPEEGESERAGTRGGRDREPRERRGREEPIEIWECEMGAGRVSSCVPRISAIRGQSNGQE